MTRHLPIALALLAVTAAPLQPVHGSDVVAEQRITGGSLDQFGSSVAARDGLLVVGAPEAGGGEVTIYERANGGEGSWEETARLTGGGSSDFGQAVAVDGGTIVVGSGLGGAAGDAHVFQPDGEGGWSEVATLSVPEGALGFGSALVLDGDTLAVGAPSTDNGAGGAWIYQRDAGGPGEWGLVAELVPSDPLDSFDRFGISVDLDGDRAVAGADGRFPEGAVYLFERDAGDTDAWGVVASVTGGDLEFGQAVAVSGDTLLVGAPGAAGAVYLFERQGDGSWLEITSHRDFSFSNDAALGYSVAIEGDLALAGMPELVFDWLARPGRPEGSEDDSGNAFVFARDAGGPGEWGVLAELQVPDADPELDFGVAAAIDGETLVVGARYAEAPGARSGSVDVFAPDPDDPDRWLHVADLTPPGIAPHDELGFDVAVDGDLAVASAFAADPLGPESGSAHLFERLGGNDWMHVAELLPDDGGEHEGFGSGVAVSGDTVAVGAYQHDHAGDGSGAVYLFERDPGDPSGWSQALELLPPDGDTLWLGSSVALDGDRLIAGADVSDRVVIFERPPGDPSGWAVADLFAGADGQLGWSVDIDGDVAVAGAPSTHLAGDFSGAAHVFERGGDGTWGHVQMLAPAGHGTEDRFGHVVTVEGDMIAVDSNQDGAEPESGVVHLFRRQGDGEWREIARVFPPDGESGESFGTAAALAAARLFVGSLEDEPGEFAGAVYVFSRP